MMSDTFELLNGKYFKPRGTKSMRRVTCFMVPTAGQ